MSKASQLKKLMSENLPNITYQRRLNYRTSKREVLALFKIINKEIFNNKLPTPEIQVLPRCREYWGICMATGLVLGDDPKQSNCIIRLMDKWYCRQWLITVLAHEMCHQYQWDVYSRKRLKEGKEPLMSHGPSFFLYRDKLEKHGISLKRAHKRALWFLHQNFYKC